MNMIALSVRKLEGGEIKIQEHGEQFVSRLTTQVFDHLRGEQIAMIDAGQIHRLEVGSSYHYELWVMDAEMKEQFVYMVDCWEKSKASIPFVTFFYNEIIYTTRMLIESILAPEGGIDMLDVDVRGELFDE